MKTRSLMPAVLSICLLLLVPSARAQQAEPKDHAAPEFPGFAAIDEKGAIDTSGRFETATHVKLVESDAVAMACTKILAAAQWRQDILLALTASAHFDNCQFRESFRYMRSQIDAAVAAGVRGERDEALASLGRALHAIQDFYSHTSYVEMAREQHRKPAIVDLWSDGGESRLDALVAAGLHSGYVWWEPGDQCGSKEETHAQLNKDSDSSSRGKQIVAEWSRSYYQVARDLALQATNEFLRAAWTRKELRGVADSCHNRIGYLVLTDQRKHE